MAKALLRFRCYKCGKLLGISAHKAGQTTACPNCKADLIIPEAEPEPSADADLAPATRALVPNLAEPEAGPKPGPGGFSWEEVDTSLFEAEKGGPVDLPISFVPPPAPPKPAPRPPEESVQALYVPPDAVPGPAPAEVATAVPSIDAIEIPVDAIRTHRKGGRVKAGDVVLSQALVTSWLVFVAIALAIAFLAGLFAGHYLWKAG